MPRDEVLVRLGRGSAQKLLDRFPTALIGVASDEQIELRDGLDRALTEEVEERVEYRVVGKGREREERTPGFRSLTQAKDRAWQLANPDNRLIRPLTNIRIQQRTITTFKDGSFFTSAWVDLEEADGSGKGERDA